MLEPQSKLLTYMAKCSSSLMPYRPMAASTFNYNNEARIVAWYIVIICLSCFQWVWTTLVKPSILCLFVRLYRQSQIQLGLTAPISVLANRCNSVCLAENPAFQAIRLVWVYIVDIPCTGANLGFLQLCIILHFVHHSIFVRNILHSDTIIRLQNTPSEKDSQNG